MNPDNASYNLLFFAPELVRDLVLGFFPDAWLTGLEYSTLEKVPASYVTDDLHRLTTFQPLMTLLEYAVHALSTGNTVLSPHY